MPRGWFRRFAALGAVCAVLLAGSAAGAQQLQPGYAVIRVADGDGNAFPYVVWRTWAPAIVTTPDGGAWTFFSAHPAGAAGAGSLGALYAARFDPASAAWQPARRLPGGQIQFGASAVVDGEGRVHVAYSARRSWEETDFSTLVYTVSDGNGGWAEPVAVAPDEQAGHQLSPSLAIDGRGGLHVAWQDQRNRPDAQRDPETPNAYANADVFVSDLVDGRWSRPVLVHEPLAPAEVASKPRLVADDDRLVIVWTVYPDTSKEGLESPARVEWSARALDPAAAWAAPATFVEQGDAKIGGPSIDLSPAPGGGVIALYARVAEQKELYLRRLDRGKTEWGEATMIGKGDKGRYPALAVAPDGTVYVVYEEGSGPQVDVGALAIAPDATTPGPDTVITPAEAGAQGRPAAAVDRNGQVWIVYFHQPEQSQVIEVRVLRGAWIPTGAD